jgi:hypothetical protein
MSIEQSLRREQLAEINGFKQSFFNKHNVYLDITIKDTVPETKGPTTDEVLNYAKLVLNAMIPARIKHRFKDIFDRTRKREVLDLRYIFIKIARDRGLKLKHIGHICGGLDHGTIINNLHSIDDLLLTNDRFIGKFNTTVQILQAKFQEHAGVTEFIKQIPNNTKPTNITSLYSGEDTSRRTITQPTGGDNIISKRGMDYSRQPFTT